MCSVCLNEIYNYYIIINLNGRIKFHFKSLTAPVPILYCFKIEDRKVNFKIKYKTQLFNLIIVYIVCPHPSNLSMTCMIEFSGLANYCLLGELQ